MCFMLACHYKTTIGFSFDSNCIIFAAQEAMPLTTDTGKAWTMKF